MECDVAIIGGGPSGSTLATLLKKYGPNLRVALFEREAFPREHVGESLLPPISRILVEMGCWERVEEAGFPIKIGATYRWGHTPERWDFDFLPTEQFVEEPRPAKFEGQRTQTAFQVDRAVYDSILLNRAAELGCEVHQPCKVAKVLREGDRVTGLQLESGETVTARYYVDASGNSGILRRAMDVKCDYPTTLRNVAVYDYWQNAEWAVEIGVGGTRIQILTVGYGWLWFIPLGPTRTSIGLVLPADYLKTCGKSPEELYLEAIAGEPIVSALTANAKREGPVHTTRDWSFLAERQAGDNWFLIGECAGFADPILSAGVTMAHMAAQNLACTILELDRGKHDPTWLKQEFQSRQSQRIKTHIRFGDYWYTANEQFRDLQEFTSKLAADIGLELTPEKAWAWIAQGGFIDEDLRFGSGGFSLGSIRQMGDMMAGEAVVSPVEEFNEFRLDLSGASWKDRAEYADGRVTQTGCYIRGGKVLPIAGPFEVVVNLLQITFDLGQIVEILNRSLERDIPDPATRQKSFTVAVQILEALVVDGWVKATYNPAKPRIKVDLGDRSIRWNTDTLKA